MRSVLLASALFVLVAPASALGQGEGGAARDSGTLTISLTASDSVFAAALPGGLSLRVEREADTRHTTLGWWLRVVGPDTSHRQSLLQPPLPAHGPHPADLLAWSAREHYFPDERHFWVAQPPLEIMAHLVNYATEADSGSTWFTGGTLEITWRRRQRAR